MPEAPLPELEGAAKRAVVCTANDAIFKHLKPDEVVGIPIFEFSQLIAHIPEDQWPTELMFKIHNDVVYIWRIL